MEKRPLVFRTFVVLLVIALFALAVYPLTERDYYEVFTEMLADPADPVARGVVDDAKKLQAANPQLFQSQALLEAAETRQVALAPLLKDAKGVTDNRDVLSMIRKNASGKIRLGLDLAGGVEFFLELDDSGASDEVKADFNRYRDIAIETLRKRLESQKIFEAEISPSGDKYIALRAPVVSKDEKLKLQELISMSAKLRFRLVHRDNESLVRRAAAADPEFFRHPQKFRVRGYELMRCVATDRNGKPRIDYYYVSEKVEMEGKDIIKAQPAKNEFGQKSIQIRFNDRGAADFARVTGENVDRQLAIVLDGECYCAPNIKNAITGGSAEITGNFSDDELKNISDALSAGSFPFEIKVKATFDTDPKLGAANIANGVWVGLFSILCVAVFMVIYYHSSGFIAVTALVLNIMLILGAMAAFNCTLTLPGIAGIVLTIGMAVDANVLVYERIREELESGKSLRLAVDMGFSRSLPAVLDSNLTTLLTSVILMYVGTGAVKGFAVTLSIGILSSLFTALFVTRLIYDYLFRFTKFNKITMLTSFRNTKIDFLGHYRKSLIVSAALLLLALAMLFGRGRDVLGVDFTGGTTVTFSYARQIPQEAVEKALLGAGYEEPQVTYKFNLGAGSDEKKSGIDNNGTLEILIRTDLSEKNAGHSPKEAIGELLNKTFPDAKFSGGQESSVGGLIGWEFTKAALWAVALSLVGIGLYIAFRFEYTYAMTGVTMLLHDVLIVIGIYLACGRTISLSVVAALLTVIGYSINDKVVIFDRIRENIALNERAAFGDVVNAAINQTLSRTVMTSVTTFIVVFILLIGDGVAINDFVLIMMLGVVFGTFSSIFIAAPTLANWQSVRAKRKARLALKGGK
ncbi:MAG: protein translocase subunit SecD [Victivallaceae bacterium]|nr:protein translocase subunit SecD [Victivallaceae bacterium]